MGKKMACNLHRCYEHITQYQVLFLLLSVCRFTVTDHHWGICLPLWFEPGCHPQHLWHPVPPCPWHWMVWKHNTVFRAYVYISLAVVSQLNVMWQYQCHHQVKWNLFCVSHEVLLQIPGPLLAYWTLQREPLHYYLKCAAAATWH